MSRRRLVLGAAAVVVLLFALVPVGRWERTRHVDRQLSGMRRVVAAVGPLDSPSLAGYRRLRTFDCLTYRRDLDPFALELCFLDDGRIVEAIDRRSGDPKIWSLRDDSTRANIRADRGEVDMLLRKMGAPPAP
jgi:hypothetical protein